MLLPVQTICVKGLIALDSKIIRLKTIAEKGQPDAQYAVGYMYYYGKGVVEDRKKAWFWINAAANLGQPDAKEAIRILARGGSLS